MAEVAQFDVTENPIEERIDSGYPDAEINSDEDRLSEHIRQATEAADEVVAKQMAEIEVVEQAIDHTEAGLEDVLNKRDPDDLHDPIVAAQIEALLGQRDAQERQLTHLEKKIRTTKVYAIWDAIDAWMWERLKKDMKWLFVDVPVYFWRRHKDLQVMRNNIKEINTLQGLSGSALKEQNRKDLKTMRKETEAQLLRRWFRQAEQLSTLRNVV